MKRHTLKTHPEPFSALVIEAKTAEFRLNDRKFKVGDLLELVEFIPGDIPQDGCFTGRRLLRQVTHIQSGYGIPKGFVMLSISKEIIRFPDCELPSL